MQTSVDYKALYEQQLKITAELRFTIEAFSHEIAQLKKMIFGSPACAGSVLKLLIRIMFWEKAVFN